MTVVGEKDFRQVVDREARIWTSGSAVAWLTNSCQQLLGLGRDGAEAQQEFERLLRAQFDSPLSGWGSAALDSKPQNRYKRRCCSCSPPTLDGTKRTGGVIQVCVQLARC